MKRPSHSPARFARLALSAWTALSAVGIFCPLMARATDLGTVGPTYEIAEPHLLQMIEQEARQRGTDSVRQPTPVAGVRTTAAPRTFYYDPTYTLDQNILGAKGELLFAAGTQANPLNVVSMTRHLLFFDARDTRQVRRARELMAHYQGKVKPILTGGSYLDLMKSWRIPVYYDQQGLLTRRLGITQVPALVSQEGKRLRIDEMEVIR